MKARLLAAGFVLGIAALLAWNLAPYLWQILTSLKPRGEVGAVPPLLPSRLFLGNYAAVFTDQPFARILFNSFVVAGASTALSLGLGAPAAFAIARLPLRGTRWILGLFLAVSMFPAISAVSPIYLALERLGLWDTHAALVFPYVAFTLPLAVWILTSFFREIPDDLYRAARVDGCRPFGAFARIFLPLAAPGLFTTAILVFIFAWNEFLFALTLTGTERSRTVPVAIALFPGLHEIPWGEIAAASVVVTAPLVALVLAFQRRILSGLLSGAVRG